MTGRSSAALSGHADRFSQRTLDLFSTSSTSMATAFFSGPERESGATTTAFLRSMLPAAVRLSDRKQNQRSKAKRLTRESFVRVIRLNSPFIERQQRLSHNPIDDRPQQFF